MRIAVAAHDLAGVSAWLAFGVERGATQAQARNLSNQRPAVDARAATAQPEATSARIIDVPGRDSGGTVAASTESPARQQRERSTFSQADESAPRVRVWELPPQQAATQPLTYAPPAQGRPTARLLYPGTTGTLLDTFA